MRKNKVLTEQIDNILDIMGVPKKTIKEDILNEQNPSKTPFFRELIDKAYEILAPTVRRELKKDGGEIERYFIKGRAVSEDEYKRYMSLFTNNLDDFERNYKDWISKYGNETEEQAAARLKNFAFELGPEFANKLYQKWVKSWLSKNINLGGVEIDSEKGFYRILSKIYQKGAKLRIPDETGNFIEVEVKPNDLDGILKLLVNDPLERQILYPKINKRLDDFITEPYKWETEVIKDIKKEVPGLNRYQREFLNSLLGSRSTVWYKIFSGWKKTFSELEDEALAYGEKFKEELARINAAGAKDPKQLETMIRDLTTAYSIQISTILNQAKIRFRDKAVQILEDSGLPKEICQTLRTDEDIFFQVFRENFEYLPEGFRKGMVNTMVSVGRNFINVWIDFIKKIMTLQIKSSMKQVLNPSTNLGTWFWSGVWGGMNTVYGELIKKGVKTGSARWNFLIAAFIWSAVAKFVGWIARGIWGTFWEFIGKTIVNGVDSVLCSTALQWAGLCGKMKQEYNQIQKGYFSAVVSEFTSQFAKGAKKSFDTKSGLRTTGEWTPGVSMILGTQEGPFMEMLYSFRSDLYKPYENQAEKNAKDSLMKAKLPLGDTIRPDVNFLDTSALK